MENIVVIDPGKTIKAGHACNFPNDDEPRVVTPCMVQVQQQPSTANGAVASAQQLMDVGAEPQVHCPVHQGKITHFDEFESLLFYVLYEQLGWVQGEEGQVVVAEPLLTSKSDREQLAQIFFEVFNVLGLFMQDSAVLALYAVGRLSGCVIDVGDSKIDIATVTEGTTNYAATRRLSFAGSSLTRLLQDLVTQKGGSAPDQGLIQKLKEKCSRAASSNFEYDKMVKHPPQAETFTLPDGQQFNITTEGHQVAEALFRPGLFGIDQPGLAEAVAECIGLGPDRKVLHENLFLCGGGSTIANFHSRFVRDMRLHTAPSLQAALCPVPEYMPAHTCQYAPWIGGAVLAKVVLQQNHFVTKSDYEESGPYAVHRKCN